MRAWEQFLEQQQRELGPQIVKKWLEPLKVLRFDAANLYLEAKDHFQALWFEEHVRKKAEAQFVNNNERKIKIHLSIINSNPQKQLPKRPKKSGPLQNASLPFQLQFDQLDPLATFDNYIQTDASLIAYKLLREIVCHHTKEAPTEFSERDLMTFNPIYLHGFSGTGKTHLLLAVANALKVKGINVLYVRADTFTDHVVSAIRAGEMSTFRQIYRRADVLILDDVHLFSRKGATQEELFHTFNALHLASKQIILSSNVAPHELQHIEPRLVSRFEWGIVLPLQPPNKQEQRKLLTKRLELLQFPMSKRSVDFLLETFTSSTKALMRAVDALILRSHLHGAKEALLSEMLSISELKTVLGDLMEAERRSELTPEKILTTVAEHFGITTEDIKGSSQRRESVLPRQLTMYLCRDKLNTPYMSIGEFFNRDHSTVMSSIKRIDVELEKGNRDIVCTLNALRGKLQV